MHLGPVASSCLVINEGCLSRRSAHSELPGRPAHADLVITIPTHRFSPTSYASLCASPIPIWRKSQSCQNNGSHVSWASRGVLACLAEC